MARMLGVVQRPWCPYHRSHGFGLDCPDASRSKGAARAAEKRAWQREAASDMDTRVDIHMDTIGPEQPYSMP